MASDAIVEWNIPLIGVDVDRVAPKQAHGLASTWLDTDETHHDNQEKHWSCKGFGHVDGVSVLRLVTYANNAADRLIARVHAGTIARFGSQHATVVSEPIIGRSATWLDVVRTPASQAWVVNFVSPTGFRSRKRFSPLVTPPAIVRSTLSRISAVEPAVASVLAIEDGDAGALWVSDIDGRNLVFELGHLTATGFVGRMRFVCDDSSVGERFGALLRFAELAGMGSYTTQGMGVVELEPTWSAATEVAV